MELFGNGGLKSIAVAVLALTLAGCATSSQPITMTRASDVPPERILIPQFPITGGGAVTLIRDEGGSPCDAGVFVGGELTARLSKGERVKIYLPAGRSVIAAHLVGKGLCGIKFQERGERATAIHIAAGDDFVYRIASPGNGVMTVTPLN